MAPAVRLTRNRRGPGPGRAGRRLQGAQRRDLAPAGRRAPQPALDSGYWKLYIDHVTQADEGADLDFLRGKRGSFVPKDNH